MQQTIFHFLGYWKTSCARRNFLPNVFTSGLIVIPCVWYLIRFTDSKLELPVHSLHSSSIIGQGFCKKEDYFDVYNTLLQHTTLFLWRWNYINFQNWEITSLMRLKGSKNDQWYYAHKALWDTLTLYVKWTVFSTPVTYISSAAGITGVNQNHWSNFTTKTATFFVRWEKAGAGEWTTIIYSSKIQSLAVRI